MKDNDDKLRITDWLNPNERIAKSKYGQNITWRQALKAEVNAENNIGLFRIVPNPETGEIAIARKVAL